jgi:hypothetical protein
MHEQNSEDPTGISEPARKNTDPGHGNAASRARIRKANASVQLALAGATWDEIATAMGYPTARTARVAVERALEKQLTSTDREVMRRFTNAQLQRLLRSVWPKAINPDEPEHLIALTKARELIGDHRKLYGLDAPTEVVVHNPTVHELEQWVARVVTHSIPVVTEFDILDGEVIDDPPALEA